MITLSNTDTENLRYAIVRQACDDYINALHTKRRLERKYIFETQGNKLVPVPRKSGGGRG